MYECDVWDKIRELIAQALILMDDVPEDSDPNREFNYRLYLQRLLDEDFDEADLAQLSDFNGLFELSAVEVPEIPLPDFEALGLLAVPPLEPDISELSNITTQQITGPNDVITQASIPQGDIEFQV